VALPEELIEILVCPQCRGRLEYRREVEQLDCPACRLLYRVDEGIPVMLVDEAEGY
jgi:uncharacterized protein YbaR (Trm112 family)